MGHQRHMVMFAVSLLAVYSTDLGTLHGDIYRSDINMISMPVCTFSAIKQIRRNGSHMSVGRFVGHITPTSCATYEPTMNIHPKECRVYLKR